MATSGTVSTTVFNTRKLIEHAYRRCRISPQQITTERIETALDLLYLRFSSMASKGIALWAIQTEILPLYAARRSVPTPVGTVDVLNCNLRRVQRITGTFSASEGDVEDAFDGDIETACTQATDGGWIQVQFDSATRIPIFGILANATGDWDFDIEGSNDGSTFATLHSESGRAVVAGEWYWFDLEGMKSWEYIRLQAGAGTTLDVAEFFVGNRPNEIPLALINRDDYINLPDKTFLSRPTQFWYDKQRVQPVITLWPSPGVEFTFEQLLVTVQRYIEDVGTLRQEVEVPQRWKLAIMSRLAGDLALEDPEVDPQRVPLLTSLADIEWNRAWDGESDSAPTRLAPNISPYTR